LNLQRADKGVKAQVLLAGVAGSPLAWDAGVASGTRKRHGLLGT
jgi:hypothetical protein